MYGVSPLAAPPGEDARPSPPLRLAAWGRRRLRASRCHRDPDGPREPSVGA